MKILLNRGKGDNNVNNHLRWENKREYKGTIKVAAPNLLEKIPSNRF